MNNTYGIVRPSTLDVSKDVEIWYNYRPNRNTEGSGNFEKIDDVSSILEASKIDRKQVLNGMFNLSLPASIFGRIGIYTIYIRPKEIEATINDVGALAAYPDIRGIVVNLNDVDDNNRLLFSSDNLTGYRVEYFDDKNQRQDYYRLITSSNLCEPISQNLTSSNMNSNVYRYNESGSLSFITLTPSTSPGFKPNANPYIGSPSQKIVITNTKFDPVCLEIEMVAHDIESIWTTLNGNTIRSLDNGIVTVYNDKGEIFTQHEFYTLKDNYNHTDKYEVKKDREGNISYNDDSDEIFNN